MLDQGCRLYESSAMRELTGETIRPGGFALTDRALAYCAFAEDALILDVGCGSGATVQYLRESYNLQAVGIDPSAKLRHLGHQKNGYLPVLYGVGEKLPFEKGEMDGVLAECTLSLMTDLSRTLEEIHRVLKDDGWFIANDVYARNGEGIAYLRQLEITSCLRGAMEKEELLELMAAKGFEVVLWEDNTDLLKQLTFKLIMNNGSMGEFWLKTSACTLDPQKAQRAMAKAKMGYFILIARKIKESGK